LGTRQLLGDAASPLQNFAIEAVKFCPARIPCRKFLFGQVSQIDLAQLPEAITNVLSITDEEDDARATPISLLAKSSSLATVSTTSSGT